MTLLWQDGMELYETIAQYSRVYVVTGAITIRTGGDARTGAQSISGYDRGGGIKKTFTAPAANDTMVLGVASKCNAAGGATDLGDTFIAFRDSAVQIQVQFGINNNGSISAYRGVTLLGTTDPGMYTIAFNFFEFKVYCHASAGTVEIWRNGTQILDLSGENTQQQASTDLQGFNLFGYGNNLHSYFDDLYVLDTAGSAPQNDVLGDCQIDPLWVAGAGNYSQFVPSAGNNEDNVDESPGSDDETTYNDGDAVDEIDSYDLDTLAAGGTIFGLKSQMTIRKTEAGDGKAKHLLRINGSDYLGDERTLSTDFSIENYIWQVNPDDAAAFETADINALELGARVTALV